MKIVFLKTLWKIKNDEEAGFYGLHCELNFGKLADKHNEASILIHPETAAGQTFELVSVGDEIIYAGSDKDEADFWEQKYNQKVLRTTRCMITEDQFQVVKPEGTDIILIRPGEDHSGRVLLFIGKGEGSHSKVEIFKEESNGQVLVECSAGNREVCRTEVAVILQKGQHIAFRVLNSNYGIDEIFIYGWDGVGVGLKKVTHKNWVAQKAIQGLMESPVEVL